MIEINDLDENLDNNNKPDTENTKPEQKPEQKPNNPRVRPAQQRRVVRRPNQVESKKVKKGSNVGGKGLIIGIISFLLLIVLVIFVFFFYLTSNPSSAQGIGMSVATVKSITGMFAGILFGSFFILFLVLGLINLFKLISKQGSKGKYIISSLIIFILGLTNIILGVIVFKRISNIEVKTIENTDDVLIGTIYYGNDKVVPMYENKYPLIGPMAIGFRLNIDVFKRSYMTQIQNQNGNFTIDKYILECGNGQKFEFQNEDFSSEYCLFVKKDSYDVKLTVVYSTDTQRGKTYPLPTKKVTLDSALTIETSYKFNDKKTEIVLGQSYDKIRFNASKIPQDLGLESNNILFDYLGDGNFQEQKGLINTSYTKDGLYYVQIQIPDNSMGIDYPTYIFPIRINSSTKPTCNVNYKQNGSKYIFTADAQSPNGNVTSYSYKVKNVSDNKVITTGKKSNASVSLKDGSDYEVIFNIKDVKGETGECISELIVLSDRVSYEYDLELEKNDEKVEDFDSKEIQVEILPTSYTLYIKNVSSSDFSTLGFDIDGDGEIDEEGEKYSFKIKTKQDSQITAIVEDARGNKSKKTIDIKINEKPAIAILQVDNNKGFAPFEVKFDASESIANEDDDSIVFFNRDFGDGNTNKQTSQGVIEHTYTTFGQYEAKVEILTENGYKSVDTKTIFVKKTLNTASITFPNNLGGQGKVGDSIKMNVTSNGGVKSIERSFGDGETFKCNGRDCAEISHTYEKAKLFRINAEITFLDGSPTTTATATINIIK